MGKRLFDIVVSGAALVLLSPALLVIGLAVRLTTPGPIIYRAARVGRDGQPFRMYKFRTMTADADKRGPGITTAGDARVTAVGRTLRRAKLDELPGLVNVLRGEMSIVGPRPEDARYVALYTPEQRAVLRARPGITSLASVRYRDEESLLAGPDWEQKYITEVMPAKLALDLEYVQRANVWFDVMIIGRTLLALFR